MQFHTTSFFSIRHIFAFNCRTIVYNTDICCINFREAGNIDLFCFLTAWSWLFIISKMLHEWEFVQGPQITLFSAIFIGKNATIASIFFLKEKTEIQIGV